MSIYPVSIQEWFVDGDKHGKKWESLKRILPELRCEVCGGAIKQRYGYVMHSITFGGPSEAFCTKKCLEKWYRG